MDKTFCRSEGEYHVRSAFEQHDRRDGWSGRCYGVAYGEPCAAASAGIQITGKGAQKELNFSVFNDHYRDAIRGNNSSESLGFSQGSGDFYKIWSGLRGAIDDFTHHPGESVNYVACHDNYTLSDKLRLSLKQYKNLSEDDYLRSEKLNALLIFCSQGIPFIHAGQEFARSKNFDHNSYQSSDIINQIDWSQKEKNLELFKFYKGLIQFRKQHKLLRLKTKEQVEKTYHLLKGEEIDTELLVFELKNNNLLDSFESLLFVLNPNFKNKTFKWSDSSYKVVIDEKSVYNKVSEAYKVSEETSLKAFSFIVLAKFNIK